jgi:hypothetical protein
MSTNPLKFKKTELARAFKAIADTGATVDRVEVSPNGTIRIFLPQNPQARVVPPPAATKITAA